MSYLQECYLLVRPTEFAGVLRDHTEKRCVIHIEYEQKPKRYDSFKEYIQGCQRDNRIAWLASFLPVHHAKGF